MQVMLLGFVLLGRSLEEKARIQASSDMNELLVSCNVVHPFCNCLIIFQQNRMSMILREEVAYMSIKHPIMVLP